MLQRALNGTAWLQEVYCALGSKNQVTDGYRPLILNHSVVGLLRFIKTRVDQTASY